MSRATVLQIVPSLRDEPRARTALEIACSLLQSGTQVFVAGEPGPLAGKLQTAGGEWIPFVNDTMNPLKLRRGATNLERLISSERIDIVHAHGAGAAWSALSATARLPVWVVTSLPSSIPSGRLQSFYVGALARGDRVIASSSYSAERAITQFQIPADRIAVIPRSVDTRSYDPTATDIRQLAAFRTVARVHREDRVILVPGRITGDKGQHVLVEAAAILAARGLRRCLYVLAGDDQSDRPYVRQLRTRIKALGLESSFRILGPFDDMRAAFAGSRLVVAPALKSPTTGRVLAQAQAMARPVIATQVGVLPEQFLAPPRMPDELRTGWLIRPGDPAELAGAIGIALGLADTAYEALATRARQYAQFVFSPESVVAAARAVYTGLLAHQG